MIIFTYIELQGIREEGIKIIGGLLHSHLVGRKIVLKHIRDGIELPPILEDNNYDFNYQVLIANSQKTLLVISLNI